MSTSQPMLGFRARKQFLSARYLWRSLTPLMSSTSGPRAPPGHSLLVEGSASIPFSEGNEVFYNKVQVFNRDMSIHVVKLFAERRLREMREKALRKEKKEAGQEVTDEDISALDKEDWGAQVAITGETEGIRVLDALAATALRSVRYLKEIPGIKELVVNDMDEAAVEAAKRNMEFNEIDPKKVTVQQGDACAVMWGSRSPGDQFDVIDLDPYGSASMFLDGAVQAVASGGLLCVTCTDMATLSGGNPEACYMRYGSMPTKGKYLHEMSLRILLNDLSRTAARHGRYIQPVMSLSIDFYIRVFVRVFKGPGKANKSCQKAALVAQSTQCPSFWMIPVARAVGSTSHPGTMPNEVGVCGETGGRIKVFGGPIWSDPIHDITWLKQLLKRIQRSPECYSTSPRMLGTLTLVNEELQDVPLYYLLPDLCATLHCTSPRSKEFMGALMNAGYRASQVHKEPGGIKTDAPPEVIWDIMRCWCKKHPVSARRLVEGSAAKLILAKEPQLTASFVVPSALRNRKEVMRYPQNPEPSWGPKKRAKGNKKPRDETQAGATGSSNAQAEGTVPGSGSGDTTCKKARIEQEPVGDTKAKAKP
ncbi:unnamed protein product [Chrysoparadoxa australica]